MDGSKAAPDAHLPAIVNPESGPPTSVPGSSESDIQLSIIVVTHNSRDVISGLIESVSNHSPSLPWELIVFDNASVDGVEAQIPQSWRHTAVIHSPQNLGFAAGVNAAAAQSRGRWLLLANPDINWSADELDRLIQFLESHPRAAAVSPRLVFPDGQPQLSIRRFPTHANIWFSRGAPWGAISRFYTRPDPSQPSVVEAVSAACLMLCRDAFHEVGGMDASYFLYVEDTDLCKRLSEHGYEIWMDPSITVAHRWGASGKRDPRLKAHHRESMRTYFHKHHADKPLRNMTLFAALKVADWIDLLFARRLRQEGSRHD
ncbi:MAG: glycosyltransferase family 2 protein [candidate division Zixibacteria bacterium]|nr:glycosyltransferase family 2 protein [candidate division Zixibacteria bacterium]